MKRGIQVTVPQHAQDRLDELTVLRDAALDAAKSTQARINLLTEETAGQMGQRLPPISTSTRAARTISCGC
jgi:hypothetical protein